MPDNRKLDRVTAAVEAMIHEQVDTMLREVAASLGAADRDLARAVEKCANDIHRLGRPANPRAVELTSAIRDLFG